MYPINLWSKSIGRILFVYLQVCLWTALYSKGITSAASGDQIRTIFSIIFSNIVFSVMECNTVSLINDKIRSGEIAMDLMKPMNFMAYTFSIYIGENIANFVFRTIPLAVIAVVFWRTFIVDFHFIGLFLISLILSFILNFIYSFIIGLIAFWLMVTWPLNMLLNSIYKFFSGVWIPTFLLPFGLNLVSSVLPFKYIYSCPMNVILATDFKTAAMQLLYQLLWCVSLYVLSLIIWTCGRKKLVIQGG